MRITKKQLEDQVAALTDSVTVKAGQIKELEIKFASTQLKLVEANMNLLQYQHKDISQHLNQLSST